MLLGPQVRVRSNQAGIRLREGQMRPLSVSQFGIEVGMGVRNFGLGNGIDGVIVKALEAADDPASGGQIEEFSGYQNGMRAPVSCNRHRSRWAASW